MTGEKKRVREMAEELDRNPELMRFMSLAVEIEETDPEAIQKATEYLKNSTNKKD